MSRGLVYPGHYANGLLVNGLDEPASDENSLKVLRLDGGDGGALELVRSFPCLLTKGRICKGNSWHIYRLPQCGLIKFGKPWE